MNILSNESLLRRIERINVVSLVFATLGAWAGFSYRIAFGVFLGGIIATASFQILKWQLRRAFQSRGKIPHKGGFFVSYYLRFLAIVFVIYTVIYYQWVNPIALLVGLSLVVLSITLAGVHEILLMQVRKGGR